MFQCSLEASFGIQLPEQIATERDTHSEQYG
jgi:hypothetical protein